jgi:L-serine dehydratase
MGSQSGKRLERPADGITFSGEPTDGAKEVRPLSHTPVGLAELFKIGLGPSSSHTMGPMKAAAHFASRHEGPTRVTLYGSLAWTGRGHSTDKAITLGLAGYRAEAMEPDEADRAWDVIRETKKMPSGAAFDPAVDIVFDQLTAMPGPANSMRFVCGSADEVWYSVGGGFVVRAGEELGGEESAVPYPFCSGAELLEMAAGTTVADVARANETARGSDVGAVVGRISGVMFGCIERGLSRDGVLPGSLQVKRRAKELYARLRPGKHSVNDYAAVYAIAVNEENAAGGRVVTAPTNGAAGVVPAVLRYYREHCGGATDSGVETFLLAATAIGAIIKRNASFAGADVGCQGEVGSAAAMAAAGLTAALWGTNEQVENAAEIAIEHHLGMTCDPVGGLVQIPCIERNAFGAVKAMQASSLALLGDGTHRVSLDQVIETMRQTGVDMGSKYKETSRGGLAVNVPEC